MNVIGACKELLTQDHDVTAVEGWTQVLQEIRTENDRQVRGFVRIAGRSDVRVPAGSASTVKVTGLQHGECNQAMIEPLTTILPGNLLVVNTFPGCEGKLRGQDCEHGNSGCVVETKDTRRMASRS